MFEFLFKYPFNAFTRGDIVFLSNWPLWALTLAILVGAGALGWAMWRARQRDASGLSELRSGAVWLLQSLLLAAVLTLLWHPALSVSTLKPRQNIVAVVVDDSRSMGISEDGKTRIQRAVEAMNGGLLDSLAEKFQVRLYGFASNLQRINNLEQLTGESAATHIGETLKQIVLEGSSLPIGAVVLVSDGADNSGGIDLPTIAEVRGRRIPIHTVGLGREEFSRDVEVSDVTVPARALADSRLNAQVTLRQHGYEDQKVRLTLRESGKVLASEDVVLGKEGLRQTEALSFNAGVAGAKNLQISVTPLDGEENPDNNEVARLVNVESKRPRILYIEGAPRWEFKFIRRAVETDRSLRLATMLRTTQNKIYRQGIDDPSEFEEGFPSTAEEMFQLQGLIVGDLEAAYFTQTQQELIRQFVDRRGGGILFLGGRSSLSDGGYASSLFSELLPVTLPQDTEAFHRDRATAELTNAGLESLICRLEEDADKNRERWKGLPELADYHEVGPPKPGAVMLAALRGPTQKTSPLLVTQNYGRGRTALFATSGSWRWQMLQDHSDMSHEMLWQQLLRWLVSETPGQVSVSTPRPVLSDEARIPMQVRVRDKDFQPMVGAQVEAHILGPEGLSDDVQLSADPLEAGVYSAEWPVQKPGSYLAEILVKQGENEVGRDVLTFRREDGVAESFGAEQNRELLEGLAKQTGGRYYQADDLSGLADDISYSEAGLSVRETRDLWDMPVAFLVIVLLAAGQWLLRRKWGAL